MPYYRCNITQVLFQDQTELSVDLLSQIIYHVLTFCNIFNKQCDHILCRLMRCLENQLLNMSCMESGKDIHLDRTTGCQSTSVRHNEGRALGPTGAYRIEYRRG